MIPSRTPLLLEADIHSRMSERAAVQSGSPDAWFDHLYRDLRRRGGSEGDTHRRVYSYLQSNPSSDAIAAAKRLVLKMAESKHPHGPTVAAAINQQRAERDFAALQAARATSPQTNRAAQRQHQRIQDLTARLESGDYETFRDRRSRNVMRSRPLASLVYPMHGEHPGAHAARTLIGYGLHRVVTPQRSGPPAFLLNLSEHPRDTDAYHVLDSVIGHHYADTHHLRHVDGVNTRMGHLVSGFYHITPQEKS